eukprot:TRINITY_DN6672_c0_g7_i1.p1 TRINITY_DN6672_c0_g7~~TRINITY_DN6672_c0_g7_i1.p1  ORF type:complete len:613 (+),score=137.58 TRINITY_DN6672_c0_g7_i1:67-1905(+)
MNPSDFNLLFVGEAGVGKSALIWRLSNEETSAELPKVLTTIRFPPQITGIKHANFLIRDSDSSTPDVTLQKAFGSDLVVVVFSLQNQKSLERALNFWITEICKETPTKPIVLVGTNSDARNLDLASSAESIHKSMNAHKNVLYYFETATSDSMSLQTFLVRTLFALAYPIQNLVSLATMEATPAFKAALRGIFMRLDDDKDGIITDEQLNLFQEFCFSSKLNEQELAQLKASIREEYPDAVNDEGFTFTAFLFLFMNLINRDQIRVVYQGLLKFGYKLDLQFNSAYLGLPPKTNEQKYELNENGVEFLKSYFDVICSDSQAGVSSKDLKKLFTHLEEYVPWPHDYLQAVPTNKDYLPLESWILLWKLAIHENTNKALIALSYIGAPKPGDFVTVTKTRKLEEFSGTNDRNVITGFVFGAPGSGKTSLLNFLQTKPFLQTPPKGKHKYAINNVISFKTEEERSIVLKEFLLDEVETVLQNKTAEADFVLFLYDGSNNSSFAEVQQAAAFAKKSGVLTLLLKTKADLRQPEQRGEISEHEFCTSLSIPLPIPVSSKQQKPLELFPKILLAITVRATESTHDSPSFLTIASTSLLSTALIAPIIYFGARFGAKLF